MGFTPESPLISHMNNFSWESRLGVHLNTVQHRISRWFYRHSPGGDKDYEFRRRELLAWVPQLNDRWTDFNTSYIGIVLLEFTR